jgi:hypothetical protein
MVLLGTAPVTRVSAADDGLYVAFGEKAGLAALMDDFVDRLAIDSRNAKKIPFTVQNRTLALLAPMHRGMITK